MPEQAECGLDGEMMEKQELRQVHKEIRNRMSAAEAAEKSSMICRKMLESSWYQGVQLVFGYYPLGREVDCLPLLKQALADGKRVALPRTGRDCAMDFFEITSLEQVEEGTFHVMEPRRECPQVKPDTGRVCFVETAGQPQEDFGAQKFGKCGLSGEYEHFPAVILVPGVVFDKSGNRYGYGKGYYDRYFSRFPQIPRMALAYENQLEEKLETLPTDVKMNWIYTENAVYETGWKR